jgi:hypothetical protein
MEEWLSGEGSGEYRRDLRVVKPQQIEWSNVKKCFQSAPLRASVSLFSMLADQILSLSTASASGILNFTAVLPT